MQSSHPTKCCHKKPSPCSVNEDSYDTFNAIDACQTEDGQIIKTQDPEYLWKKSMILQQRDESVLRVFMVKRIDDEESTEMALKIIEILNTYPTETYIEEVCVEEVQKRTEHKPLEFKSFKKEDEDKIDLLIVIGGDGSILWALQYFQNRISPLIFAFSKGSVNYLCNYSLTNYEQSVKNVIESLLNKKSVTIEMRSRIHCEILNKETNKKRTLQVLNEISLDRGCSPQVIKLNCYLENKYFATFEGDGVLIATPTGSTAYQLSAGGPILNHLMSNMVITPISPLALSTRPVVLPPSVKVTLKLPTGSRKSAFLGGDGQVKVEVTHETEVNISTSKYHAIFLLQENQDTLDNWITRLRDLLGWNRKFGRE